MTELKVTADRLALLAAINKGTVYGRREGIPTQWIVRNSGAVGHRLVTAAVTQMEAAGWVERGPFESGSFYARRPYRLTDIGRAVLDANGGEPR